MAKRGYEPVIADEPVVEDTAPPEPVIADEPAVEETVTKPRPPGYFRKDRTAFWVTPPAGATEPEKKPDKA